MREGFPLPFFIMKKQNPHLLTPWRRLLQWGSSLVILLLPFVVINGQSSVRIDIPTFSFHLFGMNFRIEEFYLFWLATVSFVFLFLLVTLVMGRVWCGWACPQTTLADLTEGVGRVLGMRVENNRYIGNLWQKVFLHAFFIGLSLLIGCNLVWYFVPPREFFPLFLTGELGPWPLGSALTVAVIIYIDLGFLRRLFCKEFCPYGRFQTVLVDQGTLTLWCPPDEAERCIACEACVRSCPMEIDIRNGFQVECINCAKCLDACRTVMAKLRQPGIIRYSFGQEGKGWRSLLTIRTTLVLFIFLAVSTSLVVASLNRSAATLKVARTKTVASHLLEDGRIATFFSGYLVNKSGREETYSIFAYLEEGDELEINGPAKNILLADGEIRRLNFVVLSKRPEKDTPLRIIFIAKNREQLERARTRTFIPVFMER